MYTVTRRASWLWLCLAVSPVLAETPVKLSLQLGKLDYLIGEPVFCQLTVDPEAESPARIYTIHCEYRVESDEGHAFVDWTQVEIRNRVAYTGQGLMATLWWKDPDVVGGSPVLVTGAAGTRIIRVRGAWEINGVATAGLLSNPVTIRVRTSNEDGQDGPDFSDLVFDAARVEDNAPEGLFDSLRGYIGRSEGPYKDLARWLLVRLHEKEGGGLYEAYDAKKLSASEYQELADIAGALKKVEVAGFPNQIEADALLIHVLDSLRRRHKGHFKKFASEFVERYGFIYPSEIFRNDLNRMRWEAYEGRLAELAKTSPREVSGIRDKIERAFAIVHLNQDWSDTNELKKLLATDPKARSTAVMMLKQADLPSEVKTRLLYWLARVEFRERDMIVRDSASGKIDTDQQFRAVAVSSLKLINKKDAEIALMEILRELLKGGPGVFNVYDLIVDLRILKAREGLDQLAKKGYEGAAEAHKKLSELE